MRAVMVRSLACAVIVSVTGGPCGQSVAGADPVPDLRVVERAERLELFAVDARLHARWGLGLEGSVPPLEGALAALVEGEGTYGSVVIDETGRRAQLAAELSGRLVALSDATADEAQHFAPRYAILATTGERRVIVHLDLQRGLAALLGDSAPRVRSGLAASEALAALLDAELKGAGMPRAEDCPPWKVPVARPRPDLERVLPLDVLDSADDLVLYSISPAAYRGWRDGGPASGKVLEAVLGAIDAKRGVLGHIALRRPSTRTRVLEAFYDGWGSDVLADCFEPRHALVATARRAGEAPRRACLLICFQCHYVVPLCEGTSPAQPYPYADRGLKRVLNELLQRQGIPLAPE